MQTVNWGKQHSLSMSSIIASISKTFTDKMVLIHIVSVDTKQRPGRKAEYCYECVCLYRPKSVGISVYLHACL